MIKVNLNVEFKTDEYYDVDMVSLLIPDETIETVKKSQEFLKANPDVDGIKVRVPENCIAVDSEDARIKIGFIIVSAGDVVHFFGQDNFDSRYQIETQEFTMDGEVITYPSV